MESSRDATSPFSTEPLVGPLGEREKSWLLPVYTSGARRDEHRELDCFAWISAAFDIVGALSHCHPYATQSKAEPDFYKGITIR